MAYLSKEQYAYRRESAARRNINNMEIAVENGMTEEQAELIHRLCSLRHELHTNMDHVVKSDEQGIKKSILRLNAKIAENGIPCIDSIPCSIDDYIDIDSIQELYEYDDVPEHGTDEWQDWYDDNYSRIYDELESLNKNIENYLSEIDKKYNTSFYPTGALRVS